MSAVVTLGIVTLVICVTGLATVGNAPCQRVCNALFKVFGSAMLVAMVVTLLKGVI